MVSYVTSELIMLTFQVPDMLYSIHDITLKFLTGTNWQLLYVGKGMNGGHRGRARMIVAILLKVAINTIIQPTICRCQCLPELDMTCVCVTCPIGCTSNFTPSNDGSSERKILHLI